MANLDVDEMLQRFRDRAAAVKKRLVPPVAGDERQQFLVQSKMDFTDFAIVADAEGVLDDGVSTLRLDLRADSD